jgi:hypothetical protein
LSVASEEQRIRRLFEQVEAIEKLAITLPEDDGRRAKLLAASRNTLAEEGTPGAVESRLTARQSGHRHIPALSSMFKVREFVGI